MYMEQYYAIFRFSVLKANFRVNTLPVSDLSSHINLIVIIISERRDGDILQFHGVSQTC